MTNSARRLPPHRPRPPAPVGHYWKRKPFVHTRKRGESLNSPLCPPFGGHKGAWGGGVAPIQVVAMRPASVAGHRASALLPITHSTMWQTLRSLSERQGATMNRNAALPKARHARASGGSVRRRVLAAAVTASSSLEDRSTEPQSPSPDARLELPKNVNGANASWATCTVGRR